MRYWTILAFLIMVGCGQKGALYMPEDKSEATVTEPAPEDASK